jgi:hypothetical protein
MWFTRALLVLGLALSFTVGASTAHAVKRAKKGKAPQAHAVHGVVVSVDKEHNTITVKVHHGKKGEAAEAAPEERTFRVTDATKFEKVIIFGKGKDQRERKPASFAAVHSGEHVVIVTAKGSNVAGIVGILERKKANKIDAE